jgi:hypothetical protein
MSPRSTRWIAAPLWLALAGAAQANLLANGSFDEGTFTGGSFGFPLAEQLHPGSTTLPGWTVTNQELAWFKSGQAGIATQDGNFALDLTGFCDLGLACGSPGEYGGVTQTVATVVGATYRLSFQAGTYLYNASLPSIVASAGGTSQTFALPATTPPGGTWLPVSMDFVATAGTTVISFGGTGGTTDTSVPTPYLGLDNASLELVSLPVPEPQTWALMLGGLLALGSAVRKRMV